jgi:hypothetical protein
MERQLRKNVDAQQLRDELAAVGLPTVAVTAGAQGETSLNVPDDVDAAQVARVVQAHFPRTILKAVADVDVDSIANLADARRVLKQLQAALVKALRSRWE